MAYLQMMFFTSFIRKAALPLAIVLRRTHVRISVVSDVIFKKTVADNELFCNFATKTIKDLR